MNPYKKLGGQTLVYGMGNIVPRILNYAILTFYYTRRFSVEEFGVITELYAYVAILLVVLTYGMETGLFKFSEESRDKNLVFQTSVISVSTTSIIFWLFVIVKHNSIAQWIGYSGNPEYIIYMGSILAADAVAAIIFAKLRIENKVRKFATFKIINVVITIVLVLIFLEAIPRLQFITETNFYKTRLREIGVGYVLIANILASVIILLLLIKEYITLQIRFNLRLLGKILVYSLPLLVAGLAGMFNEAIDRILLRNILDKSLNPFYEVGIYGANYRIAVLMTLFVQMFRYAAEPFFFNYMKSKNAKEIYADVLKYFTIFMVIVFLIVTLYIDLFKYFIDSKYHEGLKIVPVVLFANILVGMLFNVNMWFKITGKTIYGTIITGIGATMTIVLNIIFIPKYSYIACAWIHVIVNLVMLVITYYTGQKHYKIKYDIGKIAIYTGLGLGIFFIARFLRSQQILINVAIGTILLGLYIYFCNKKENLINIFVGQKNGS